MKKILDFNHRVYLIGDSNPRIEDSPREEILIKSPYAPNVQRLSKNKRFEIWKRIVKHGEVLDHQDSFMCLNGRWYLIYCPVECRWTNYNDSPPDILMNAVHSYGGPVPYKITSYGGWNHVESEPILTLLMAMGNDPRRE